MKTLNNYPETSGNYPIKKRDTTRTPPGIPGRIPVVFAKRAGVRRIEVEMMDSETGKKKKPQYAAGSYVYLAVTPIHTARKGQKAGLKQ